MSVIHQLAKREAGIKRRRGDDHFPFHRKRVRRAFKMGDVDMDKERHEGDQDQAFMIPGVDGKLQFGFPKRIMTKLRYAENLSLVSATGNPVFYVFRMNSANDPDYSGGGHQPLWFDQYAAIYSNYRVHGSKLTVTFSPNPTTDNGTVGPYVVGIAGSPDSTALSSVETLLQESSDTISRMISRNHGPTTLTWHFSPETSLGFSANDDVMGATVANNPSQVYYAHIFMSDLTGPASSIVVAKVELELTVEFFKLKTPTQS